MSIEITIKYTDAEYKSAIKEKIASMPNKSFHSYMPTAILVIIFVTLVYFEVANCWWGVFIIILLSIYAIPCLLSDWLIPQIALALARKEKLQDSYHFTITEEHIERISEKGVLCKKWGELVSVDFFSRNIFFNLDNGSMLIPISRLTTAELQKLKGYLARP